MYILPALDLYNHQVVRLRQGRFDEVTVYSTDICQMAKKWVDQGAKRLHLVDLNGAYDGKPCHFDDIRTLISTLPGVEIEVGGGVRDLATVERYFEAGVAYCILGTAAIRDPDFVREACLKYPHKIILGVDAKNGFVAIDGWEKSSTMRATDLVQTFSDCALESVIYTDIAKDGMLASMNFEQIEIMAQGTFPVIASGGLTDLTDIQKLLTMRNIHGVIAGKAIYENRFSVKEAVELVSSC